MVMDVLYCSAHDMMQMKRVGRRHEVSNLARKGVLKFFRFSFKRNFANLWSWQNCLLCDIGVCTP